MFTRILPNGDELVEAAARCRIDLGFAGGAAGRGRVCCRKQELLPGGRRRSRSLASLLLIEDTIGATGRGWALSFALGAGVIQAVLAVARSLLDAGVITPPAPRPKYDQYRHYGQYGGYYGQQQSPYQQSGYPRQYGGYSSRPSTGGFSSHSSGPIQSPQPGPQQSSPQGQQHGSRPRQRVSRASARRRRPAPAARVRRTPQSRRLRTGEQLVRPGPAAADAVLTVGPVTVLTVRTRARRVVASRHSGDR